ncbi:MAG: M20/M25/M40 family metallo-hydrolase [Xanthomonadales bacterium]
MFHTRLFTLVLPLVLLAGAAAASGSAQIEAERLSDIVRVLASDEFEGRAPGTPGEEKTVAYLIERFQALGLQPGGADGGWTQAVPLVHTRVQSPGHLAVTIGATERVLHMPRDIAVETSRPVERITIDDAPVVFVGFGVSAPERQWDDFGDIDLHGKVALFLVNDPDFAAAADEPVAGRFGGRRMTYYGRWTYKFEEAARRGAIAALVIHEDAAAGYGWNVAASSPGDNYALDRVEGAAPPVLLQGWLHGAAAAQLFDAAGLDLAEQRRRAREERFRAFELDGVTFSAGLSATVERIESRNVLARLPGSAHPDETLMVSAHWDAYGLGEPDARGRTVRPGANDDALGVAGVLEMARVLKAGDPLERSVVFAVWTAEESGLLGSAAYAANPLYPVETTVANLTIDIMQTAGPARDVILVGEGQSELEDDLARAAATQGRVVTPENLPENGLFYRADHFSLVEGGRAAGDRWIAEYVGRCYHQTCDEWSPDWDLRGAVQDIELFRMIVEDLGNSRRWPEWKPGSEFRDLRVASAARRN